MDKQILIQQKQNLATLETNEKKVSGLENGLEIGALKEKILNKGVTISYASPTSHINKLVFNGQVFYSELKQSR